MAYSKLSKEIINRIEEDKINNWSSPYRCNDDMIIRRDNSRDVANLWRQAYVRDIEKIMHVPYYNRYADKTQVFSFYKNDDITRRALHVQLVSRIARNIGNVLGLNESLIEAISLGHDIGHTPFGHAGERFLDEIYNEKKGIYFNQNVHSVRVLDGMNNLNISLQTLDGILCHNGEFEQQEYRPIKLDGFDEFDLKVEGCYVDSKNIDKLVPSTLEACVVRICDMVAYLGKDRQDAIKAKLILDDSIFTNKAMGIHNAEIINNLTVNIIENSYGKDYILLDEELYSDLKLAKKENYEYIYKNEQLDKIYEENIKPMFHDMYNKLLEDLRKGNKDSVIYKHHIDLVNQYRKYYLENEYINEENQIIVDYMASMTDDYFMDLYNELFPNSVYQVNYISYFE